MISHVGTTPWFLTMGAAVLVAQAARAKAGSGDVTPYRSRWGFGAASCYS
jgi:hypothetical protein